jgi:hypothetical protein
MLQGDVDNALKRKEVLGNFRKDVQDYLIRLSFQKLNLKPYFLLLDANTKWPARVF